MYNQQQPYQQQQGVVPVYGGYAQPQQPQYPQGNPPQQQQPALGYNPASQQPQQGYPALPQQQQPYGMPQQQQEYMQQQQQDYMQQQLPQGGVPYGMQAQQQHPYASQQFGYGPPQQQQQQYHQQPQGYSPLPQQVPVPAPPLPAAARGNPPLPPSPRVGTATGRLMRPPYTDPVTQIIYDVDNPEYEGWLTKQSTWLKEWRRRYFILKGSKLFFCKNAQSGPHGMMDLASCTTVKSADLKSGKRHSFEISTADICYLLYADTESEKDDWIGRVGKAIVRCSRTYYRGSSAGGAGNNHDESEDDDIYENDDPDNPYFND